MTNGMEAMKNLLTTQHLCVAFGVTAMTIHNWRKKRGLPCEIIAGFSRPAIRYKPDRVERWAKKQNLKHRKFA